MIFFATLFEIALLLFFFLLGSVAIFFALLGPVKREVIYFLQNNLLAAFLFGVALVVISFGLMIRFFLSLKKKRYTVRNASLFLEISPLVVESSCKKRLQHLFPEHEIFSSVQFQNKNCVIELGLPKCKENEQKKLVHTVEKEIKNLLQETLDYRGNFLLHIYFS